MREKDHPSNHMKEDLSDLYDPKKLTDPIDTVEVCSSRSKHTTSVFFFKPLYGDLSSHLR